MYSRNLFVLDFVRRFFVSCAQIFEAYAVRTLIKFGCDWRKIGRKGKCMKDSGSTFYSIHQTIPPYKQKQSPENTSGLCVSTLTCSYFPEKFLCSNSCSLPFNRVSYNERIIGFSFDFLIWVFISVSYRPFILAFLVLGPAFTGWPPPMIQPLRHAIISTKSYSSSWFLIFCSSLSAFARPFTTAARISLPL